jgi:hypothetical protein
VKFYSVGTFCHAEYPDWLAGRLLHGPAKSAVRISRVSTFDNDESKTDNFKIKPDSQTGTLNVITYYDTKTDGVLDGSEVQITGWEVKVGAQGGFPITAETKFTPASIIVEPGCYTAQEGDATGWIHTTTRSIRNQ